MNEQPADAARAIIRAHAALSRPAEQQGSEGCRELTCPQHGPANRASAEQQEAVGTRIARLLIAERNTRVLHSPAWFAFDDAARIARKVDR